MDIDKRRDSIQGCILEVSHAFLQRNFEKAMELQVHPGQIPVFRILSEHEGFSQREIAEELKIKPPTVNVSIQRMEKSGFVYRKPDVQDQRVTRVYLTEKGRQVDEKLKKIMDDNEEVITRGFSESELCLLKRMLREMTENLEHE